MSSGAQGLPASCRDVFQLQCTCGLSDWTACGGPGWIPCKPCYRKTAAASQVFSKAGLFPGKCEPHAVLAGGEESGLHGVCCCCWAGFQQGGAAGSCNSHTGSWRSRSLFLIHHQGVDVNPEVVTRKKNGQYSERSFIGEGWICCGWAYQVKDLWFQKTYIKPNVLKVHTTYFSKWLHFSTRLLESLLS